MRAVDWIRHMQGGAQSKLMLDEDNRMWVVKFQNNPQGIRILANELIATRLAESIGLPVPVTDIVDVPGTVLARCPKLTIQLLRGQHEPCLAGEHFGSAFVGGLMPALVVDYLPDMQLNQVRNLSDFAGILAFDMWTGNRDGRQAVFQRTLAETKYRAIFIDQGFCFNAGEWNFPDSPIRAIYTRNAVYAGVAGWSSFEPWLSRIEQLDSTTLWRIAESVPPNWYGGNNLELERLMEQLFTRRLIVRQLILACRDSMREPFPLWSDQSS